MFTGLVEEIGIIRQALRKEGGLVLTIAADEVLKGTKIGDSIAVNGACLTVTALRKDAFEADVTPETAARTYFPKLRAGDPVDLERALRVGDRLGGHFVSGHIDGTGRIVSLVREGNAVNFTISFVPDKMKYILEKGSVAVDGVSLTIAKRGRDTFTLSLIPHTGARTVLLGKKPGDPVNIECDMLGKYVEQLLRAPEKSGVTMDMLRNYTRGGQYGSSV